MRNIKIAAIVVLVLGLCFLGYKLLSANKSQVPVSGAGFDDVAYFDALRDRNFKLSEQSAVDVDAVVASMPEFITFSYGDLIFNEARGSTRLNDVKLYVTKYPDAVLDVGTMELWGVDEDALIARLSRTRLDQTVNIASRIEVKNTSMVGLETLFEGFLEATNDWAEGATQSEGSENQISDEIPEIAIGKMDMRVDNMIITNLVAHPWTLRLTDVPEGLGVEKFEVEDGFAEEIWHFLQKFAAWNYVFSYDDYATYDLTFEVDMVQDGAPFSVSGSSKFSGSKGFDRGDLDFGVVRESLSTTNMSMPVGKNSDGSSKLAVANSDSKNEFYSYENLKLAPVWKYLSDGKLPPRTDTDIMSWGIWRGGAVESKFNGEMLYTAENSYFDMSKFHWVIPERIEFKMENFKYYTKTFSDYMRITMENAGSELDVDMAMTAEQEKTLQDSLEILGKYGLAEPVMDLEFGAHWDAQSGATDIGYSVDVDDFITYKSRTDIVLPDYESVMVLVPEKIYEFENMDEAAWTQLFENTLALKQYKLVIDDKGGLKKSFEIAVDFAQILPDEYPSAAMFKNTTPEILRNMASSGILVANAELSKSFPPAVDYVQSLSNFISKGGKITVVAAPPKPLGAKEIRELETIDEVDPEAIVEMLGISVIHTPPQ